MVPPAKSPMADHLPPQLLVTTSEDTPVRFTVFYNSSQHSVPAFSGSFTAENQAVTNVTLPKALRAFTANLSNSDIAVNVKADVNRTIAVYLLNEGPFSADIALLLPKFATKTNTYNYYAASIGQSDHLHWGEDLHSYIGIVGTEDNCTVAITPTANATGHIEGVINANHISGMLVKSFPLRKNSVIFLMSNDDLTGTKVTGTCYLFVITGHQCASCPSEVHPYANGMEQVPPAETWGFKFFLTPLAKYPTTSYRLIAGEEHTEVTLLCNGAAPNRFTIEQARGFKELFLNFHTYCFLESNLPMLVAQFSMWQVYIGKTNTSANASVQTLVTPVKQFKNAYNVILIPTVIPQEVLQSVMFDQYLNLVVTKDCCQLDEILYDGQILPANVTIVHVTCTDGKACGCAIQFHLNVSTGTHTLRHARDTCGIGATLYAHSDQFSYGSLAGTRLESTAGTF